jgi:hypothetical protein
MMASRFIRVSFLFRSGRLVQFLKFLRRYCFQNSLETYLDFRKLCEVICYVPSYRYVKVCSCYNFVKHEPIMSSYVLENSREKKVTYHPMVSDNHLQTEELYCFFKHTN